MEVTGVDPRDVFWEVQLPTFRVYFWDRPPDISAYSGPVGLTSDEYEVTGADIHDVISWANRYAESNLTYAIYLLVSNLSNEKGMVKLAGQDPNDPYEPHASWMVQRPY